jgi:hypothetical protein
MVIKSNLCRRRRFLYPIAPAPFVALRHSFPHNHEKIVVTKFFGSTMTSLVLPSPRLLLYKGWRRTCQGSLPRCLVAASRRNPLTASIPVRCIADTITNDNDAVSTPQSRTMRYLKRPSRVTQNAKNNIGASSSISNNNRTIGEHLRASGESIASSSWILIQGIPPISSLHNMLAGLDDALNIQQQQRGIVNMDAPWSLVENQTDGDSKLDTSDDDDSIPAFINYQHGDLQSLVHKALVVLSPFGRPTGWRIQFTSPSIVQALLQQQSENPILCAWKQVKVTEYKLKEDDASASVSLPEITSATLRVENFPHNLSPLLLMNLFSRFDLDESHNNTTDGKNIEPWVGTTSDGKSSDNTWLVHFADSSWARAALREKQSTVIKGNKLVLAPYPEQIL